jgi:hypothetical protein
MTQTYTEGSLMAVGAKESIAPASEVASTDTPHRAAWGRVEVQNLEAGDLMMQAVETRASFSKVELKPLIPSGS